MSATGAPLLVVNADDYGLTRGISRGILEAHRHGVVTSTSVLAVGPAYDEAVRWLDDAPDLGIGAHLAVVGEDPPLLSASEVPTLFDPRGRLWLSWRQFLPRAALGRIDPADVAREFAAQVDRLQGDGLVLDHLDTHQHLHLWPAVRDVLLDLGERVQVRSVRVTRASGTGPVPRAVGALADRLVRAADRRGWSHPQGFAGFDEAGGMDVGRFVSALQRFAAAGVASAEVGAHPGEAGDADLARYPWRNHEGPYRWGDELAALCSRTARAAVEELGFRLGTFAELGP